MSSQATQASCNAGGVDCRVREREKNFVRQKDGYLTWKGCWTFLCKRWSALICSCCCVATQFYKSCKKVQKICEMTFHKKIWKTFKKPESFHQIQKISIFKKIFGWYLHWRLKSTLSSLWSNFGTHLKWHFFFKC